MSAGSTSVSVIIPVYQGEAYLGEAIRSALSQTHPPLEVLVIDDGSTDRTREIVTAYGAPVRYVHQTNAGPAAARNRGLRLARGDAIAFLDADDLWTPHKLAQQTERLESGDPADVVLGYAQPIVSRADAVAADEFELSGQPALAQHLGSALIRRSAFDRIGVLDESRLHCEDWDWFMRAREEGLRLLVHTDVVLYYRQHPESLTRGSQEMRKAEMLKTFKKSLDRRRRLAGATPLSLASVAHFAERGQSIAPARSESSMAGGQDRSASSGPPLVSAIVPVFNGERYVGEAVQSILDQDYTPLEVIVIDDGSIDRTARVLEAFGSRIRYVHQNNRGLAGARNTGVGVSRGQLLAFLDHDDLWLPGKLASQAKALEADEKLDMVFGHTTEFFSPEMPAEERERYGAPKESFPGLVAGALLVRRDAFLAAGSFSTQWRVGEFIDWLLKATEAGLRHRILPEVVLHRRIHGRNMTLERRSDRRDYLHIIKQAMDRRRRGGGSG